MEEIKSTGHGVSQDENLGEPATEDSTVAMGTTSDDKVSLDIIEGNLVYDNDEVEPEVHARTYIAVLAMALLNFVQVVALQGPPTVVSI